MSGVSEPINLAPGIHKDHTLGNGKGLIQVTEGLQFPLLLANIDIKLFDTFEGEFISLHKYPHRFIHELASDLKGLWWHGSREYSNLDFRRKKLEDIHRQRRYPTLNGFLLNKMLNNQLLHMCRAKRLPSQHIKHTPRCANNNMNTGRQNLLVLANTSSSHTSMDFDAQVISSKGNDKSRIKYYFIRCNFNRQSVATPASSGGTPAELRRLVAVWRNSDVRWWSGRTLASGGGPAKLRRQVAVRQNSSIRWQSDGTPAVVEEEFLPSLLLFFSSSLLASGPFSRRMRALFIDFCEWHGS
ncbi:hypothetical protein M5K25_027731 [Dendrobium thyrsiflorum]|uniref:Uncharacterized protein n=1 Tax=Dendrobium thyrsiflorum TaxID=117978 RepID=A0ABD0TUM5_DENTH